MNKKIIIGIMTVIIVAGTLYLVMGKNSRQSATEQTPTGTPQTQNENSVLNALDAIKPVESGCAQEGSIKSPASYNKANITFDNQTNGDLKVYWITFTGQREFRFNLKAHTKLEQETWVGHVWVVADGADKCVKLHSANQVSQLLVIN